MTKHSWLTTLSSDLIRRIKKIAQPTSLEPMLATLTTDYFSSDDWIYEHKYDGERCIAYKKNGVVLLKSRNNNVINDEYPELVLALEAQQADNFIIDGEIMSINKAGLSDFQLLQGRMHVRQKKESKSNGKILPIQYAFFDLIYSDGYDIRALPLLTRKKILKKLFTSTKIVHYSQELSGDGLALFKKACSLKWEGLIVKRGTSTYVGHRSHDWLKFKCSMKQELVIAGYTEPKGARDNFGALLVGYYEKGNVRYAGKVGTGYTQESLTFLGKKLQRIEIKTCPFSNYDGTLKGVHWVKPILVAEFEFAQWTKNNKLRVGRYKGLRDDKAAHDVVQEVPKSIIGALSKTNKS